MNGSSDRDAESINGVVSTIIRGFRVSRRSGSHGLADTENLDPTMLGRISNNVSRTPGATQPVLLTGVGLQIPSNLSYERWERVGHQLSGIVDSSGWWLGDWLVFGKRHFSGRYQRAIRAAGLSYQTLRNYAWVSRRFTITARRSTLTFQHHAEVASLPVEVRERWLDLAEEGSWTTKQLRKHIKDEHVSLAVMQENVSLMLHIEVPSDRLNWWRRAADESGVEFRHWMMSILDQAAQVVLVEA